MVWHFISWYLLLLGLGWLTFPLTFCVMSKLADRGYALSRILGLLLWGFIFWLSSSLGLLHNQPGGIVLVLVVLILVSFLSIRGQLREFFDWIRTNWRVVVITEVVFLFSFIFMALVRASNPEATGTEKPMELAFINAVINSESFPPHDPWLSGYAISYYHFGYILAGLLAKITGVPGGVAFNLMLAAVFAMSAAGAYSILNNLLMGLNQRIKRENNYLLWALLGPLFLLFVSNLEAFLEVLRQAGVGWDLASGTSEFWTWVNIGSLSTPPPQPLGLVPQRFWWWWQASRVIQDIDLLGNISSLSPIDEFPAFSFVLGDLHPHVLVMPFVMLVIGLSWNVFQGGLQPDGKGLGRKLLYRADVFLVAAITMGGIAFLNTWDLPVYFALFTGAYLFWRVSQEGWQWRRLVEILQLVIPLGVLSFLLYSPFFVSFQSQAGGILPNLIYPTRGLYLWLMFAALFVPIFLFFGWLMRHRFPAKWGKGTLLVSSLFGFLFVMSILMGFIASKMDIGQQVLISQGETSYSGLLLSATLHRISYGVTLLTLLSLLTCGLSYLLGISTESNDVSGIRRSTGFVLLMIILGGVMVLAPEFVYLRDVFGARMNTVFKFYYQAWMLWALAAAFATVVILRQARWISRLILIIFLLLGLIYPVLAYPDKTNAFNPEGGYTLDAAAYLARQNPDEAAAIGWVSQATDGVVAEAVGGQYSGYARVATLSGQPSVLGWPGHEGQWRGGYEEVGTREADIRTLFEVPDWARALVIIRRYDIRYIFVGRLERSTYAVNSEKFMMNLEMGFSQGEVQVFVIPPTLKE